MSEHLPPPIPDPRGTPVNPPPYPPPYGQPPYGGPPHGYQVNHPGGTPFVAGPRDWNTAPKIVKSWAYQLTWLALVVLPLISPLIWLGTDNKEGGIFASLISTLLLAALWGLNLWLNRALKQGTPAAWTAQIVLSAVGLLSFPVGTLIHGYVLSQWFSPEVKAWFSQQ